LGSRHELAIEVTEADEFAELSTSSKTLPHIGATNHWDTHQEILDGLYRIPVTTGLELWNQKESYYPHMEFCDHSGEQLKECQTPALKGTLKMLGALNDYARALVNEDRFDKDRISCESSSESKPTLDTYSECRTFKCPDGQNRLFDWHVKHNYSTWRVHFIATPGAERPILIGYIGKHLPTVKDPH